MADSRKPQSRSARNALTADYIRSLILYDPETGAMVWRKYRSHTALKGQQVGRINTHGYRVTSIDDIKCSCHRLAWLIMTGEWPADQVDHINRNRADLRWNNLRAASNVENQRNRGANKANGSGFKGVTRHSNGRHWVASIRHEGKTHYLGLFRDEKSAHACYAHAVKTFHGEFGCAK